MDRSFFNYNCCIIFFWFSLFGPEQKFVLNPYIDTEMSIKFTPKKFQKIKKGMDKLNVIAILGNPLFIDKDYNKNIVYNYTQDGKLLNKKVPWFMVNDYAWFQAIVVFNNDTVIQSKSGFIYD